MGARASCSSGQMASCLPRRAPDAAAAEPEQCSGPASPVPVQAPKVPSSKSAPVLLPISSRASPRADGKSDGGDDDLPRAGLNGAGCLTTTARSTKSRKSCRHVTFGGEELKHFETVGRMRSVR